jgi:hypothetical protein
MTGSNTFDSRVMVSLLKKAMLGQMNWGHAMME